MSRNTFLATVIINTLAVALIASYLTTTWHNNYDHQHNVSHGNDFHHWLHTQLNLTPEQETTLHQEEKRFEVESVQVRLKITQASHELARAVKSGDPQDQRITSSLHEINTHQLQLKKLMIDHFFEMKKHLNPEQAEMVRQWIHDSLISHPASAH